LIVDAFAIESVGAERSTPNVSGTPPVVIWPVAASTRRALLDQLVAGVAEHVHEASDRRVGVFWFAAASVPPFEKAVPRRTRPAVSDDRVRVERREERRRHAVDAAEVAVRRRVAGEVGTRELVVERRGEVAVRSVAAGSLTANAPPMKPTKLPGICVNAFAWTLNEVAGCGAWLSMFSANEPGKLVLRARVQRLRLAVDDRRQHVRRLRRVEADARDLHQRAVRARREAVEVLVGRGERARADVAERVRAGRGAVGLRRRAARERDDRRARGRGDRAQRAVRGERTRMSG
jgi:hypothetical protein